MTIPTTSPAPAPQPARGDAGPMKPKIIEAADCSFGGPRGADFALTCEWLDGTETLEYVSEHAARLLGYDPDENGDPHEASREGVGVGGWTNDPDCLGAQPIEIDYTNYRGERGVRLILPTGRMLSGDPEFHPGVPWVIEAVDCAKAALRTFDPAHIHRWTPKPAGSPIFAQEPSHAL